jgi:hypothetical protein
LEKSGLCVCSQASKLERLSVLLPHALPTPRALYDGGSFVPLLYNYKCSGVDGFKLLFVMFTIQPAPNMRL